MQIVIPVYNAVNVVKECFAAIDSLYSDRDLIVVDDFSDVETRNYLISYESTYKNNTVVIRRSSRGWFTRAVNTGVRHAMCRGTSDKFYLINSDCILKEGSLEELNNCWVTAEKECTSPVGLVGAHGPNGKKPMYEVINEPQYITGHLLLLSKDILKKEKLRFPQEDGDVKGFTARDLIHIRSDKALSYELNRRGYLTIASWHAQHVHKGGASWDRDLSKVSEVNLKILQEQ